MREAMVEKHQASVAVDDLPAVMGDP